MKQFSSTLYLPMHRNSKTQSMETDPHGYLFAKGIYRTKIQPEDLPAWYVGGYMHGQHGYISAKGVRFLVYKPDYITNHLHKDDLLYISYNLPIEQDQDTTTGTWYHGYDHVIYGNLIIDFLTAAEKYSGYDVSKILSNVKKKEKWYHDQYE